MKGRNMLNIDYIIPGIVGKLGNNLFMIAHAYAKGLDYDKQVVVCRPDIDYNNEKFSENIFRKLEFVEVFDNNNNWNPSKPSDDKHTQYSGYFQSESYFEKYSENIKSLFGPSNEFIRRIKVELPQLFKSVSTVINVRRGDYLGLPNYHPVISVGYINHCISMIKNPGQFVIASDDIPWCKENIKIDGAIYLEGYKGYEQLWVLSMCTNFIISNSSFSWWAAYLSRAQNKIVMAPGTWFGPDGPQSWNDMYCKGWTVVPTYFSNGQIHPKL